MTAMVNVFQCVADGGVGGGTTHVLQILANQESLGSMAILTDERSYLATESRNFVSNVFETGFFRSRLNSGPWKDIRAICATVSPKIVHVHGNRAGFQCLRSGIRIPMIYTVHGFHFPRKKFPFRILAKQAERLVIQRANHVIFVAKHDLELATSERLISTSKRYSVIYNGIPVGEKRLDLESNNSVWRAGFVARFVSQKNPELFVRIVSQCPTLRAAMVGDGIHIEQVKLLIENLQLQDRIKLLGALSREKVLAFLRSIDCLVMTSRWEGLPIIILEAMREGVPIVTTGVGGIPEIIEHGKTGFIVQSENPLEFVRYIEMLASDSGLRKQIQINAYCRFKSLFSEEEMISKIAAVYRETVRID